MIALEPRGKGLMGTLLSYPYEVRDEAERGPSLSRNRNVVQCFQ